MWENPKVEWIIWWIFVLSTIFTIAITLILTGCAVTQPYNPTAPISNNTTVIWKVIQSTDWLASLFMVGFVLGIIGVGLGFGKLGLVSSFACVAGLFLKASMSNVWFYTAAGLIVVASALIVLAGIVTKNKALRELVQGIQQGKTAISEIHGLEEKELINTQLKDSQSKTTRQVVESIKAYLKIKGQI